MNQGSSAENLEAEAWNPQKTFSIRNLVYTRAGIVALFSWLLWGDFMFQLMEAVEPKVLPLLLKQHGATNQQIAFIAGSIMMMLNTFMNPVISYNSDRTRTRWGRRKPYIIITTPFVVLFLAATPFAPEILDCLQTSTLVSNFFAIFPVPPIIMLFGFLVVAYQIFNLFVASVYYYLLPDVVPHELLGRFYSLFRIVSGLSGLIFNYFIFKYAETDAKAIFVGVALIYGIVILMMCWKIDEGEYPPLAKEKRGTLWDGISNYGRECFSSKYYWTMFLGSACINISACSNLFYVFLYNKDLGYSLDQFGKLSAYVIVLQIICYYSAGIIIDRWGAHKTLILGLFATAALHILSYFMITDYWSGFIWMLLPAFSSTLLLATAKLEVITFPGERYGQFCSAQALVKSIAIVGMNYVIGVIADKLQTYWFLNLWKGIFLALSGVFIVLIYLQWLRRGAREDFRQEDAK
ncbi:MAG: MFS transporter [Victivallaceae bacterium]|jgi:MFS family permease